MDLSGEKTHKEKTCPHSPLLLDLCPDSKAPICAGSQSLALRSQVLIQNSFRYLGGNCRDLLAEDNCDNDGFTESLESELSSYNSTCFTGLMHDWRKMINVDTSSLLPGIE